jgi:hypothetical protein
MCSKSLYRVLATLIITVVLTDASTLKTPKELTNKNTVINKTLSWDAELCGKDLKANGRTVSTKHNLSTYYINGVQSAQPCSKYSVQVVKGQYIMIGFAPRLGFKNNDYNFINCGWFLDVSEGTLWAQDGTGSKSYVSTRVNNSKPISDGSVVTAIHDYTRNQIEFQVDGISFGIAFTNVPRDEVFAAADFYGIEDAEIRISENGCEDRKPTEGLISAKRPHRNVKKIAPQLS